MVSRLIVVKLAFDSDANVWYVDHSSLEGMSGEAETMEAMVARIPCLVADLLEEQGGDQSSTVEVPIEIIASRRTANETLKQAGLPKAF
jgi:Domain of unknown function (DUF1902)